MDQLFCGALQLALLSDKKAHRLYCGRAELTGGRLVVQALEGRARPVPFPRGCDRRWDPPLTSDCSSLSG